MSASTDPEPGSIEAEPSEQSFASKEKASDATESCSEWAPESSISNESRAMRLPRNGKDLSDDVNIMSFSDDDENSDSLSDNNDEHCSKCHDKSSPESLLCCDGCPRVYHLQCLQPKLEKIPNGKWYCPDCQSAFKLSEVDKVLAERTFKSAKEEGGEAQFYVKWKHKSYRHCTWIQKTRYMAAKKFFCALTSKLKAFQTREQDDFDLEGYDPKDFTNGVHRNWLIVDKILESKGVHHGMYFVKWLDLSYEQSTWEQASDIKDVKDKIKEFHQQITIRQEARRRLGGKNQRELSNRASSDGQEEMFATTPSFLTGGQLHPYQLEGLNWLKFKWHQQENIVLADEMGLGKTIQAIALLAYLWSRGVANPHLVVVPLSTMQNWMREFEIWAPQLKVAAIMGSKGDRDIILKHEVYLSKNLKSSKSRSNTRENQNRRVKCHVILASYEVVSLESLRLGKVNFECLIVDEGHRLKTKSSRLVKDLNNLSSRHRLLLTGTPLQNNIQELFALLHFLDDRKFDSWESFEADFANISQEDQVSRLHGLLLPHLLRRLKKDVLQHLPPKKEQIVRVEMSDLQRSMYKGILAQNYEILTTDKKREDVRRGLLSIVTELRKCCMHPFLFDGVEVPTNDQEQELKQLIQASGKLELLDKMLDKLIERGHRVLIYSQFVIMLNIIEDYLVLKKIGHLRIDGSILGGERQTLIDRFNKEPDKYSIFLLSTRAGGLGINLATADTVILYDSDYNPHNDIQAQARAHRLGQQKPVMIYRLVTRITIEERMMQLAKEKLVLEQIVVRKLGHRELKQAELDGILKYGTAELFADEKLADIQRTGGTVTDQELQRVLSTAHNSKIVYDKAAIERLLDRSNMETEEQDKMELENGELMAGFKIANFDLVTNQSSASKDESWQEILKGRHDVQQMLREKKERERSGGRRRRKQDVTYKLDDAQSDGNPDSDFNVEDHEEDDDSSSSNLELEEDMRVKAPAPPLAPPPVKPLKRKEQPMIIEPAKKRPVQETQTIPYISWKGSELLVYGFNRKERQLFLKLLLRFGFPDDDLGAWEEFKSRLPRKRHQSINDYAKILVSAAGGAPLSGAALQDFLFDCKPEELMTRIGMIHLFKERLRALDGHQMNFFQKQDSCQHLYQSEIWKELHDCAMLRNVVKYGYGRWKDILCNGTINLEDVLCKELKLEPIKNPKASNEVIEIDISTSSEGEHGESEEKGKRQKQECTEEKDGNKDTTEDPAALKSRIRSTEAKCRNWLVNRLKSLAAALTADQTEDFTIQVTSPSPEESPNPCYARTLKSNYQNIIRHCALVRDSSSLVLETRTYAEILAAGEHFRKQLTELESIAGALVLDLPETYEEFIKKMAPVTSQPNLNISQTLDTSLRSNPTNVLSNGSEKNLNTSTP